MNRGDDMSLRRIVVLVLILCCAGRLQPARAQDFTHETAAQRDARMSWWRDARFGMFIHWGAYAVAAGTYKGERIPGIGEWIMSRGHIPIPDYEEFVHRFNPTRFDPAEWVRIAKDAGMKYMVIVEASRRVRHLRLEGLALRHRRCDAIQAGRAQGAGTGGPSRGPQVRRVLLDHGLAPPRRPGPERNRIQFPHLEQSRFRSLRRDVHEAAAQGAAHAVSRDRRALVRWRMDRRLERRPRTGSLRLRPRDPPAPHREQPGGAERAGPERPEPGGSGRAGRLRDPGAAGAPPRASRRRLGNLHDDERHLGLQVVRRRLEGHAHPAPHAA